MRLKFTPNTVAISPAPGRGDLKAIIDLLKINPAAGKELELGIVEMASKDLTAATEEEPAKLAVGDLILYDPPVGRDAATIRQGNKTLTVMSADRIRFVITYFSVDLPDPVEEGPT